MSDFEPTTDVPDSIDTDDRPVESSARSRDQVIQNRRKRIVQLVIIALALALLAAGFPVWRVVIGMAIMYAVLIGGFAVIGAFARPVPEPLPPGELRRVKLTYRCPECGAELRMTLANEEVPSAPRHCTGEMDLIATREDGH